MSSALQTTRVIVSSSVANITRVICSSNHTCHSQISLISVAPGFQSCEGPNPKLSVTYHVVLSSSTANIARVINICSSHITCHLLLLLLTRVICSSRHTCHSRWSPWPPGPGSLSPRRSSSGPRSRPPGHQQPGRSAQAPPPSGSRGEAGAEGGAAAARCP